MSFKRQNKNIFNRLRSAFLKLSNLQIILIVYAITTFTAAGLLMAPISIREGKSVDFIDALFTAASAFSDTGLTTVTTVTTWTGFGQGLITVLILLGGIGIFALKFYIINIIFKKSVSLMSRNVLEKERGSNNSGDLKKTIKISISFLFITIIIATFILWLLFYFEKGNFVWLDGNYIEQDFSAYDPNGNILLSLKCAIFHSISAINNAGFDILSNNSLFPYYGVYSIQIVFIILLILGGIGFPVIYDVIQFFIHKMKRRTDFSFSLFTKVSCLTYAIVFFVGLSLTLMFEIGSTNGIWKNQRAGSYSDKMMAIWFHVFSTRNAGFTTLDPTLVKFTNSTLIVFSIMMFIGSAPSSTAGGIRTTTLALVVVALFNKIRGINKVTVFKRQINDAMVSFSFFVLVISCFIILTTTLVCSTSFDTLWGKAPSGSLTYADIFYDVCSAFGTTGLSTGLTSNLNIISKIFMILTMFIGQLGISSTILVWRKNNKKDDISYIQEDILVG